MEISNTENKLIYMFGVTCTMNAIMLGGVSLSNFILLLLIVYKILLEFPYIRIYRKNKASQFILLFTMSIIFSIFSGITLLPSVWISNSVNCFVKYTMLFLFIFLIYNFDELFLVRDIFLKGFFVGALIQLAWGYAQLIFYFVADFKLNTFVFERLLNITGYTWDSYVAGRILRMKGIGWETANFALVMLVGYILTKKYNKNPILEYLFIGAIFLSTSKSGYISLLMVLAVEFIMKILVNKKESKTKRRFIYQLIAVIFVVFVVIMLNDAFGSRIKLIVSSLSGIFDVSDAASSNSIHISYYTDLPGVLKESSIVRVLFGNGYFSSGYIYSNYNYNLAFRSELIGWNPESDFVTLIVSNGLFGCMLYYFYAIKAFLDHRRDEYGLMVIAIISLGITYLSIRGSWSFLIVVFAMIDGKEKHIQKGD